MRIKEDRIIKLKKKKIHGCKVYKLEKGLSSAEAYSAICSRVRRIYFKYWSYDSVTGKARAMG